MDLTVPFALAAGLSGAVASSALVVTAGVAEIAAGSIAMGLGGYLAAKTDREHYIAERTRELRETEHIPEKEAEEVAEIFRGYGLRDEHIAPLIDSLQANPRRWVDFMMRFELGLEEPDPSRARWSAWTIALSYVVGGLIPLLPYMVFREITTALWWSVAVTPVAAVRLRLRQKRLHRCAAMERRGPHGVGRRARCRGGLRDREAAGVMRRCVYFLSSASLDCAHDLRPTVSRLACRACRHGSDQPRDRLSYSNETSV